MAPITSPRTSNTSCKTNSSTPVPYSASHRSANYKRPGLLELPLSLPPFGRRMSGAGSVFRAAKDRKTQVSTKVFDKAKIGAEDEEEDEDE